MVLDNGVVHEFDSPQALMADEGSLFTGMCHEAGIATVQS
jgi:ABC-type multidrug transport system fused ATPase/permease subunit